VGNPYIFSSSHSYPIAPEIQKVDKVHPCQVPLHMAESAWIWSDKGIRQPERSSFSSSISWWIYYEYSINTQCEQAVTDIAMY